MTEGNERRGGREGEVSSPICFIILVFLDTDYSHLLFCATVFHLFWDFICLLLMKINVNVIVYSGVMASMN